MTQYFYKVHGISICSEIELPGLTIDEEEKSQVDIKMGKVPEHLPNITGSGVLYEATKNDFLFTFDSVARYRVQNGTLITIQPDKRAVNEDLRLFLLGSCIGALLQQRGALVMHGTTITTQDHSIIISGRSGTGKSSVAAGLIKFGHAVISDDISVVEYSKTSGYFVFPGIPYIKLWKDVLLHLNQSVELEKVRPNIEKYLKPIIVDQKTQFFPLRKIIVLTPSNSDSFKHTEVFGSAKFNIIKNNSYRIQYIDKLHQAQLHFQKSTNLASSIRVFVAERPITPLRIMEFANYISENIILSE